MRSDQDGVRRVFLAHPASGLGRSNFPVVCEVKDDEIVRCLPFHVPDAVRLYEIRTSRGTFTRPRKDVQMPLAYSWKHRVHSDKRVRFPMLRKGWKPGDANVEGRGSDEYVRISWDEALDIVAGQLKGIQDRFGNMESVLVQADGHGQSGYLHSLHFWAHYLFDKMREGLDTGWWTQMIRNPDSWEGYYWGAKHVWGFDETLGEPYQDAVWDDVLENTEMVIMSGNDPEATGLGMSGSAAALNMPRWLKQAGIKIVALSPDLNHGGAHLADTWIPIRPNTDAALYLALAYVWIEEDIYQKGYVRTRTVGFEEFRAHVMGVDDGVAKSPEWAFEITGIEPYMIRALAREWAAKKTTLSVYFGGPKIRGTYSHLAGRLEAYILAMQGFGMPGRQFLRTGAPSFFKKWIAQVPRYPAVDKGGIAESPLIEYAIGKGPMSPSFVPRTLASDAILNAPVEWQGTSAALAKAADQFETFRFPPSEDHPGVRVVWNENGSQPGSWGNGYRWLEALRQPQVEFVVGIHPWLEGDITYSDLILPAQTLFEHSDLMSVQRSDILAMFYQDQAIPPVGESKSDYEIHRAIGQRLGIGDAFPEAEVLLEEAYAKTYASTGLGIGWQDFKERKGVIYDCPTWEEWLEIKKDNGIDPQHGGSHWYASSGEGLQTQSGKIEFTSLAIAEHQPDSKERPSLATWMEIPERLGWDPANDERLMVVTNHPRFRFHVQGDDIEWIQEISKIYGADGYAYEPCWIHPDDAAQRRIEAGNIVALENERGTVLVGARVTARIMPGSIVVEHGSRIDLATINDARVDRGGSINLIAPSPRDKYGPGQDRKIEVPEMNVSGFFVRARALSHSELRELTA